MTNSKFSTVFFLLIFISFKSFSQNPEVNGQWSNPIQFDIVPVAVANLPDGRLLTWSSKSRLTFGGGDGNTYTQIFDPTIGPDGATLPDTVTNTNHDMFCPGINNLADGRIMATGGSSSGRATIYDPLTETWVATDNMTYGRGYQGAVTLSDGSAFVIGGSWSGGDQVKDAEVWTEATGWTSRPGLGKEFLYNANDDAYETQNGSYRMDNHAWLWAAPNGKIFHAGPGETMHWFDVSGNGSATVVGQRGNDIYAMNGATVMFDIGKILKFGGSYTYSGGTPSSDNAYVIDFNNENAVTVTATANNAAEGRIFPSAVALPDGEVLILGGMDTSVPFSDNGAHFSAEMYNPTTNLFRTLSSMQVPRTYHSAGILMNDGRVFMGGGGLCGNNCPENHTDAEIFSPPYLFDNSGNLAVRPTLSAPNKAYYDNTFSVVTSPDVTDFAFIRLSSATHSTNNEQRRVPVTFTGNNGNYQLNMPNANIMPPGYYMLFAMNTDGVPSISETVLVGNFNLEDNLALNQSTSQSSLYPNGESFKAVDGNTNGDFNANPNSVTHTAAADNNAWWRVDLGDEYEYALDAIRIYNRSTNTERLTGATVYIGNIDSTDPLDYTEVGTLTDDLTQVLTENMGIARYVMIRQSGILSLAEVEVFGQGINCPVQGTACDDGDVNTSNDIENGNCSCEGIIISCDNIETVAQVDGESFTGETEITVTEDDDITLSLNLDDVVYTIEDPDGNILGSNSINAISFDQSGLYTFRSSVYGPITNPTVYSVTSEETVAENGNASNAVDGLQNTIWHTKYNGGSDPYPHTITLDLGLESAVSGLEYSPRQDASLNGTIAGYEIYVNNDVSNDPNNWGAAVSIGVWAYNQDLKTVSFPETQGRYVRLRATSEGGGNPWATASEIDVIATGIVECVKTLQINVTAKPCEELAIVYEINGESGTGETEITVTEGDDIGLFLNSDIVTYTVEDPNAVVLPSNTINNIGLGQSGLYTVRSTLDLVPGNFSDPVLLYVDSEETTNEDGRAINALDGDPNTIWHTRWSGVNPPGYDHEIQLDLGENSFVSGFTYLPRIGGGNGTIANYEIYVSNSTTNWGTAVSTGTWANNDNLKTVNFPAVQARYLRFVAKTEVSGNIWASAAEIDVIRPVPTVLFVDSEQTGEEGLYAIDGDPNTFWHTQYSAGSGLDDGPPPHEIQIDLGIESSVSGLEYLPRQDATLNGTIANYEIYVSNDTNNWGTAVSTGTWASNNTLKTANFTEIQGRYVRLRAMTEVNTNPWTSVAELNVLRTVATECVKTIQINVDTVTMYTYNNGWLPSDPNNVSNFNDEIMVEAGEAVISMNTIVDDVTVDPGAALTVNTGIVLTANTTTLKSTSQLYSSLMADGTLEGEIKYERFVNANLGGNDLVSPPLAGEAWIDFLGSNTNAADILNDGNVDPQLRTYLFGPFDKTADSYVNYTGQNAATLVSGTGYRAGTAVGANLTFTGTVPTTPIAVNIINSGATYPDWNLIGNPYPSYLDMNLFLNYVLDAGPDPDVKNIDILENISGIYGYAGNAVANKWDVITLANASDKLMAPGQGFFVAANAADVAAYDITFDPSMRTIGTDDDFVPGRNASELTYLKLNAGTANTNYGTEFYFNANASLGIDLGYDGKILGNVAPNFALYSHLVEDNTGLPIALQALNPSDLVNTIIPLGVNSNQGEQITFSISETTLPSNVDVYLEDNVTNTVTLLNSGDYTFTPNVDLSGTGRFYLRVSSSVLSVGGNELDYIQIYTTTNPKSLIINGQLNGATMMSLYDIQGRLVINKPLNHLDVVNTIDISRIGTGVYIVKVSNDSQSKTQKLIIK